jgi:hypothetical protein
MCTQHISTIIDAANDPACCLSTGRRITASILKTELYCLCHYIDAMMYLAPLGKAQQYCSAFNFQFVFRGLFFTVRSALPKNAD